MAPPIHRLLHPGLALGILFVGVLTGCGPQIACMDFPLDGGDCERIAGAALPEAPPDANTLTVVGAPGSGVRTWTGGQLPFECDR